MRLGRDLVRAFNICRREEGRRGKSRRTSRSSGKARMQHALMAQIRFSSFRPAPAPRPLGRALRRHRPGRLIQAVWRLTPRSIDAAPCDSARHGSGRVVDDLSCDNRGGDASLEDAGLGLRRLRRAVDRIPEERDPRGATGVQEWSGRRCSRQRLSATVSLLGVPGRLPITGPVDRRSHGAPRVEGATNASEAEGRAGRRRRGGSGRRRRARCGSDQAGDRLPVIETVHRLDARGQPQAIRRDRGSVDGCACSIRPRAHRPRWPRACRRGPGHRSRGPHGRARARGPGEGGRQVVHADIGPTAGVRGIGIRLAAPGRQRVQAAVGDHPGGPIVARSSSGDLGIAGPGGRQPRRPQTRRQVRSPPDAQRRAAAPDPLGPRPDGPELEVDDPDGRLWRQRRRCRRARLRSLRVCGTNFQATDAAYRVLGNAPVAAARR